MNEQVEPISLETQRVQTLGYVLHLQWNRAGTDPRESIVRSNGEEFLVRGADIDYNDFPVDVKSLYEALATSFSQAVQSIEPEINPMGTASQVYATTLRYNDLWSKDAEEFERLPDRGKKNIVDLIRFVQWINQIGTDVHIQQTFSPENIAIRLGFNTQNSEFVQQVWYIIALIDEYGRDPYNLSKDDAEDILKQRRSNLQYGSRVAKSKEKGERTRQA